MALLDLYTERNITNSCAVYLGAQLKALGYLVYWYGVDAVETADGLYTAYSINQQNYLADATFAGRVAAAKGLVTLCEGDTPFPVFLTRSGNDGTVGPQGQALVPSLGISVGPDVVLRPYEQGTLFKWRARALTVEGRVRNKGETQLFADKFAAWLFEDVSIDVIDHDGTSGEAPGAVRIARSSIARDVVPDAGEADRFQVELMARLEYVA
jgi:hypothetical protein